MSDVTEAWRARVEEAQKRGALTVEEVNPHSIVASNSHPEAGKPLSEYEKRAFGFLRAFGIRLNVRFNDDHCPPYSNCTPEHTHGDRYEAEFRRGRSGQSLTIQYWASPADKAAGRFPTIYDVMRQVAADTEGPTTPEAYIAEFGVMPIAKAKALSRATARFQRFFTAEEREQLRLLNV